MQIKIQMEGAPRIKTLLTMYPPGAVARVQEETKKTRQSFKQEMLQRVSKRTGALANKGLFTRLSRDSLSMTAGI